MIDCLRAQLLAQALVSCPVLRHVSLITIHGYLALSAADECSSLALRVIAGPSQLVAKILVIEHVQHGVGLATVQRDPAPWTFVQGRVLCLHPALWVLALSDCPLKILCFLDDFGVLFLYSEHETRQ